MTEDPAKPPRQGVTTFPRFTARDAESAEVLENIKGSLSKAEGALLK